MGGGMKNEFKYIEMVYRMGSFSGAARALYMSQPALSIAVQKIESEIGMPLFDRSRKPLALTDAGRIYIEKVRQMEQIENELQNRLSDLSSMNSGTIRIGATGYIISRILPPVLLEFKRDYPGIRIELTETGSYELRSLLTEQKIDITFISRLDKNSPFEHRLAFRDQMLLAVPSDDPVNERLREYALDYGDIREGRHWEDSCPVPPFGAFSDVSFILLDQKYNLRHRTDLFFEQAGFLPRIQLEAAQITTACALAQAGLGASFLPDRLLTEAVRGLVYYKVGHPQARREMYAATNAKSYKSLSTIRFIDKLAAFYARDATAPSQA